jgi:hypothetical protein
MKKVGIITINDNNNYGNRLQNYATQEIIKSLGFEVETLINKSVNEIAYVEPRKIGLIDKIKNVRNRSLKDILKKIDIINKIKSKKLQRERACSFKNFTDSFIKETKYEISNNNIPKFLSYEFDYFVVGSDQIWNPVYGHGTDIDFLKFAPRNKRIAYAPSFGISSIPVKYHPSYSSGLCEFKNLSVREHSGAKIIKQITGIDPQVLIDPTMVLTKEKWRSVAKQFNNKPKSSFLLTYFLGNLSESDNKIIENIASSNSLKIVHLSNIWDEKTYLAGPSEFIDLIDSATIVCTDSFHGVVFSILMETPFVVFNRKDNEPSMESRLQSLLSTFALENRLYKNINKKGLLKIDYSYTNTILKNERIKSLDYIKSSLKK